MNLHEGEIRIFQANKVTTIFADDLHPYNTKSSTAMVLNSKLVNCLSTNKEFRLCLWNLTVQIT